MAEVDGVPHNGSNHSPDSSTITSDTTSAQDAASRQDTSLTAATLSSKPSFMRPSTWFGVTLDPHVLWGEAEGALRADDVEGAKKCLKKLAKCRDRKYEVRAQVVLMAIAVAEDWHMHSLSSKTTKLMVAAAQNGSYDAAALLWYLNAAERCNGTGLTDAELASIVRRGAEDGFAPAQAVWGLFLARAHPFENEGGVAEKERGKEMLVAAGKKGHFLALDRLEWHVMNERSGGSIGEDGVSVAELMEIVKEAGNEVAESAMRVAKLVRRGVGEGDEREWVDRAAKLNLPSAVSAAHAEAVRDRLGGGGNAAWVRELEELMDGWRGRGKENVALYKVFAVGGAVEIGGRGVWRFCEEREGWWGGKE